MYPAEDEETGPAPPAGPPIESGPLRSAKSCCCCLIGDGADDEDAEPAESGDVGTGAIPGGGLSLAVVSTVEVSAEVVVVVVAMASFRIGSGAPCI